MPYIGLITPYQTSYKSCWRASISQEERVVCNFLGVEHTKAGDQTWSGSSHPMSHICTNCDKTLARTCTGCKRGTVRWWAGTDQEVATYEKLFHSNKMLQLCQVLMEWIHKMELELNWNMFSSCRPFLMLFYSHL